VSEQVKVAFSESPPRVSEFQRFRRVFFARKVVIAGFTILGVMLIAAIFCNWLAPYDPYSNDLSITLQPPSSQHWLGTDEFGRDILSRLLYGARTALVIGFASIAIAGAIGITMGVISGYLGGVTSLIVMRIIDTLMAFPLIILALIMAALLGGGMRNLIIALSIATIPPYARILNGETLSIRENDYITSARASRASTFRIILKHIIPNAFPAIMVQCTLQLGMLILTEAGLSFLGIGIEPPGAAWGSMVADGNRFLLSNPILSFAPGLAIVLAEREPVGDFPLRKI
jgi:peptide/nickel transport system permease protein